MRVRKSRELTRTPREGYGSAMVSHFRRYTRHVCCLVCACLLFMQLAVSAYACPNQEIPKGSVSTVMHAPDMGEDCQMLDPASPNLCLQHCQAGSQLPDGSVIAIAAPGPIAMLDFAFPPRPALVFTRALRAHTTAPPLTVRNCCFRI